LADVESLIIANGPKTFAPVFLLPSFEQETGAGLFFLEFAAFSLNASLIFQLIIEVDTLTATPVYAVFQLMKR